MKNFTVLKIALTYILFCISHLNAQTNTFPSVGAVGIGTLNPEPSARLEIKSFHKGFLMPRMTQEQRDAIISPAPGLEIYQTNGFKGFYFYDDSAWKPVGTNIWANTSLSNLSDLAINKDLNPLTRSSLNLGTFDHAWNNLFLEGQVISQFTGVMDIHYSGSWNVSVGAFSIQSDNVHNSTAIGAGALFSNLGSYNTGVGMLAMSSVKKGSNNVGIGYRADVSESWFNNSIALGSLCTVTASNQARIGTSTTTSIGGFVDWTQISDARFNENVKENVPGLKFINRLRPVTYTLDVEGINNKLTNHDAERKDNISKRDTTLSNMITPFNDKEAIDSQKQIIYTGFNAQDVKAAANEINFKFSGVDGPNNDDDFYGLRYGEFVPPLVKAVQELSKQNDELKKEVEDLKCILSLIESQIKSNISEQATAVNSLTTAKLEQNVPNPFKQQTTIKYYIPDAANTAFIKITNANGETIKVAEVTAKGFGQFTFQNASLAAGNYTYSLFIDGKLIDTKKMLLTK